LVVSARIGQDWITEQPKMEDLQTRLDELIDRLDDPAELRAKMESLVSIYPFNRFEYVIAHLLAAQKLTLLYDVGFLLLLR